MDDAGRHGNEQFDESVRGGDGTTTGGKEGEAEETVEEEVDPYAPLDPHDPGTAPLRPFRKGKTQRRRATSSTDPFLASLPVASATRVTFPEFTAAWQARLREVRAQKTADMKAGRDGRMNASNSSERREPPYKQAANEFEAQRNCTDKPLPDSYGAGFDSDGEGDCGADDFFGEHGSGSEGEEEGHLAENMERGNGDAEGASLEGVPFFSMRSGCDRWGAPLSEKVEVSWESSYEELLRAHIDAMLQKAAAAEVQTGVTARVAQWKDRIGPAIEEQDARPPFDIHAYGKRILTSLQEHAANPRTETDYPESFGQESPRASFLDIVQGPERYEVSRLFSAMLQLVNNGNIELDCSPPSSSLSTSRPASSTAIAEVFTAEAPFHVRLLSTRLHHEEMLQRTAVTVAGEPIPQPPLPRLAQKKSRTTGLPSATAGNVSLAQSPVGTPANAAAGNGPGATATAAVAVGMMATIGAGTCGDAPHVKVSQVGRALGAAVAAMESDKTCDEASHAGATSGPVQSNASFADDGTTPCLPANRMSQAGLIPERRGASKAQVRPLQAQKGGRLQKGGPALNPCNGARPGKVREREDKQQRASQNDSVVVDQQDLVQAPEHGAGHNRRKQNGQISDLQKQQIPTTEGADDATIGHDARTGGETGGLAPPNPSNERMSFLQPREDSPNESAEIARTDRVITRLAPPPPSTPPRPPSKSPVLIPHRQPLPGADRSPLRSVFGNVENRQQENARGGRNSFRLERERNGKDFAEERRPAHAGRGKENEARGTASLVEDETMILPNVMASPSQVIKVVGSKVTPEGKRRRKVDSAANIQRKQQSQQQPYQHLQLQSQQQQQQQQQRAPLQEAAAKVVSLYHPMRTPEKTVTTARWR
eukprot:TRINITY_DN2390_c0_g1_i1.p1 TRINITY_DN2390_c0_g1~~TRINITY_DN2390_c0_g1_i1.p1  ORF type:complete len:1016 (+),score=208.68 TRINITY_DN2390_c0_g1_i1:408-3050(+)